MNDAKRQMIQRLIQCLDAINAAEGRNIKDATKSSHLKDRNLVARFLEVLVSVGLASKTVSKGRSEKFVITPTASVFLEVLKEEYHHLYDEIRNIRLTLVNYTPRRVDEPNEIERFLITSRIEIDTSDSPYSRLQAFTDAFSLAANALDSNMPEHQVAEDVSILLKSSTCHLLSEKKNAQEEGRALLKEAERILESVSVAKETAKELGLADKRPVFREIGKDGRGRPIYQVKSFG